MGTKSAELAARFEQCNGELMALVSSCPEAEWRATTADEPRTPQLGSHEWFMRSAGSISSTRVGPSHVSNQTWTGRSLTSAGRVCSSAEVIV